METVLIANDLIWNVTFIDIISSESAIDISIIKNKILKTTQYVLSVLACLEYTAYG